MRDKRLEEKRNTKIRKRFNVLYCIQKKQYTEVMRILSEEEFFLSVETIEKIIKKTTPTHA